MGDRIDPGGGGPVGSAAGPVDPLELCRVDVGAVVERFDAFVALSTVTFAALRPVARRLDATTRNPLGVGATRLVGEQGIVLSPVPAGPDEVGLVRIGREEWRAQSLDGSSIASGTPVTVLEVRGTRVIVSPTGLSLPTYPPERPLS